MSVFSFHMKLCLSSLALSTSDFAPISEKGKYRYSSSFNAKLDLSTCLILRICRLNGISQQLFSLFGHKLAHFRCLVLRWQLAKSVCRVKFIKNRFYLFTKKILAKCTLSHYRCDIAGVPSQEQPGTNGRTFVSTLLHKSIYFSLWKAPPLSTFTTLVQLTPPSSQGNAAPSASVSLTHPESPHLSLYVSVSDLLTSERSKRPSPYPFYCPPPPYLTTVTGESALPFRLLQTAKTSIHLRWDGWAKQRRESVSHCSAHWWASKWRCSGKLAR